MYIIESEQELERVLGVYKRKLKRLIKLKKLEPNNEYHNWEFEIKQWKSNITEIKADIYDKRKKDNDWYVEKVKNQPTADNWIPCSERLPSSGGEYKVTIQGEKEKYIRDNGFEGQATNWYIECPHCNTNVPTRSLTEQNYYEWYKVVCELYKSEYDGECP